MTLGSAADTLSNVTHSRNVLIWVAREPGKKKVNEKREKSKKRMVETEGRGMGWRKGGRQVEQGR